MHSTLLKDFEAYCPVNKLFIVEMTGSENCPEFQSLLSHPPTN
jgi:hypothetical protein